MDKVDKTQRDKELFAALEKDTSPEMLIRAATPMLEDILGMWVVSKERKRLVRALLTTLQGPDGPDVAAKVAKNYNPYGDEQGPSEGG